MKNIIWLEMVLIGSSILIFRSVWTLLDSIPWATSRNGLTLLLAVGIVATVVALHGIEAHSAKEEEDNKDK